MYKGIVLNFDWGNIKSWTGTADLPYSTQINTEVFEFAFV